MDGESELGRGRGEGVGHLAVVWAKWWAASRVQTESHQRGDGDAPRRRRRETAAGRRPRGDGRAVTATGRQSRGDWRRETGAGRRWRGDGGAVRRWRRGWGRDVNDMKMIIFFLLFSTFLFRKLKKKKKRSNWILHTS